MKKKKISKQNLNFFEKKNFFKTSFKEIFSSFIYILSCGSILKIQDVFLLYIKKTTFHIYNFIYSHLKNFIFFLNKVD